MTAPNGPRPDDQQRHLADLDARVQALEAWRTYQSDLLDDLINGGPSIEPPDDEPGTAAGVEIDALVEWVELCVTGVIARPLRGEQVWCPMWWDHAEAVMRFAALHRAWLQLAPEPGASMSVWIRDHLDPCLRELLSPLGPFADCGVSERHRQRTVHTPIPTLPTMPRMS